MNPLARRPLAWVGTFLTLAFALFSIAKSQATDPDQPGIASQVRKLVRQLDAGELKSREEAEEALVKLGAEILPLLKPYLTNPETSATARQSLEQIQRALQLAGSQAELEAKTITLSEQTLPLSEILAAFEQQTGNKIVDLRKQFGQALDDPKIKVAFQKTPYWQALDRILDDTKLTLYPFAGREGLAIVARPDGDSPRSGRATYSGPFRFEATKLIAERDLRNPAQRSLKLGFEVAWEPRLAPVSIRQALDQIKAVDDQGRALTIDGQGAREVLLTSKATAATLDAPLVLPPRDAKKIASLKGSVSVLVLGGVEEFTFENLAAAKNKTLKQGDVTVTLRQARKNNELWEVLLQVSLSSKTKGIESHTNWVARNEALLVGPDKQPLAPAATESQQEDENAVGLVYLFAGPKALDGCSFVYKSPTAAREIPIEFELKDLELP